MKTYEEGYRDGLREAIKAGEQAYWGVMDAEGASLGVDAAVGAIRRRLSSDKGLCPEDRSNAE